MKHTCCVYYNNVGTYKNYYLRYACFVRSGRIWVTPQITRARVGSIDLVIGGDIYELEKPIFPPDRHPENKDVSDIALVKTKESIRFSDKVNLIELPNINPLWCEELDFQIVGWGISRRVRIMICISDNQN